MKNSLLTDTIHSPNHIQSVRIQSAHRVVLAILVFISLVYSLTTANSDLVSAGEARAAEIAREMVDRGNYILPSLNHEVSTETMTKPPLFHWMLIGSGKLFGWNNVAMHLPAALAAAASIVLVFVLGTAMFNIQTGLFSAVVLTASVQYLTHGATARIDMLFAFLILAALTAFYIALANPEKRRTIFWFYICCGLAVLSKGPAGFFIPVGVALFYLIAMHRLGKLRELYVFTGLLVFAAIAVPWYVAVAKTAPPELVEYFFFGQLSHWWSGSGQGVSKEGAPFWAYAPYLLFGLFPWSLYLLASITYAISDLRKRRNHPVLLLLFWFLGGLLIFSFGGKKAARYLLPILPAASLLIGYYLGELMHGRYQVHLVFRTIGSVSLVVLLLAILGGLLWGFDHYVVTEAFLVKDKNASEAAGIKIVWAYLFEHQTIVVFLSSTVGVLGLMGAYLLKRKTVILAVVSMSFLVWVGVFSYALWIDPMRNKHMSPRQAAVDIRAVLPENVMVYGGGDAHKHALRWYLGRNIRIETLPDLYKRVWEHPDAWVIISSKYHLPGSLREARPDTREWVVDYYTITLFPPAHPTR